MVATLVEGQVLQRSHVLPAAGSQKASPPRLGTGPGGQGVVLTLAPTARSPLWEGHRCNSEPVYDEVQLN